MRGVEKHLDHAGMGKATMLELVLEAAVAKGWKVVGFSNGSEQAATMEHGAGIGIAGTTTARHLIDEYVPASTSTSC